MEYGIQRRSIDLVPPDPDDLAWICGAFDDPKIYQSLGLTAPSSADIRRRYDENSHVFGVIRAVADQRRIGFVVMFPPTPAFDAWSMAYAIPEPRDRNAYHALHATDAIAHYMFEHLRVEAVGWETQEGSGAPDAIVRRLGYSSHETRVVEGRTIKLYRIDREGWSKRRAKLDADAGGGATFVTLRAP